YIAAWMVGHYPIWRAAPAGAAVSDWLAQYNIGDGNVSRAGQFGGAPWTGACAKLYPEQSAISGRSTMRRATLIMSDTGAVVVRIQQSVKLYDALRDNKVPVQFIAYPVSGHSPGDPVRQQDVNRRYVEWLDKYLESPATSQAK